MRITYHVVLALLVLLAAPGVHHAVASPVLTDADMAVLHGGCGSQKYCASFRCGLPTETCKQNVSGGCDPTIPSIACDNHQYRNVTKQSCFSLTSNPYPCTRPADPISCGTSAYSADCNCDASHVCKLADQIGDYVYYKCP